MPTVFLSVIAFILGVRAEAKLPYASLEKVRAMTVVVRTAVDFPQIQKVKHCLIKNEQMAQLAAQLALQTENSKAEWSQLRVEGQDLASLKEKLSRCELRGSCSVYSDFLNSVKNEKVIAQSKTQNEISNEVQDLRKNIEQKLTTLDAKTYKKAWDSVKNPCKLIQEILKNN